MKKATASNVKLQLKKDKIVSLTHAEMANVNGGTMPQVTPVFLGIATLLLAVRTTSVSRGGVGEGLLFSVAGPEQPVNTDVRP